MPYALTRKFARAFDKWPDLGPTLLDMKSEILKSASEKKVTFMRGLMPFSGSPGSLICILHPDMGEAALTMPLVWGNSSSLSKDLARK